MAGTPRLLYTFHRSSRYQAATILHHFQLIEIEKNQNYEFEEMLQANNYTYILPRLFRNQQKIKQTKREEIMKFCVSTGRTPFIIRPIKTQGNRTVIFPGQH